MSAIAEEGINCDFCHTVKASSGIGNGAFISMPGRVKWGPFDDSNYSTFHLTATQELSDLLFGKGKIRPPVIEMTSTNITLGEPAAKETPGLTAFPFVLAIIALYIVKKLKWQKR
ncbi:MAG: hypothetical protein OIN88_02370 [Candidatus Methanoperedens sp.]|nr:hypothetical protein [Candidatus Methanoperedens sp.]